MDVAKKLKNTNDQELSDFINRLRKEREAAYLLKEIERDGLISNSVANKDLSIKDASDEELDLLIRRLNKEREAQRLIADIKRQSGGQPDYERVEVSTEQPVKALYHFGVKGMKWGVRRSKTKTSVTKSEDHIRSRRLKKKKLSELSDVELKQLTSRLQLEKQYKDLAPQKINKGKKFVDRIIDQSATQVVTKLVTGAALLAAKKIITAKYGDDVAAQILPKKK